MKLIRLDSKFFPRAIVFAGLFLLFATYSFGATYFSRATGNWNVNTTWSTSSGGSAVGAGVFPVSGDIVNIEGGFTVTVTANAACATMNLANSTSTVTVTVNSGFSLTVSGSIILQNDDADARNAALSGAGTIICDDLTVGGTTTALNGDDNTILTLTISTLTITGDLSINGEDDGSDENNSTVNLQSGNVTVEGNIVLDEEAGSVVLLTMATGAQTGTLFLENVTPFSIVGSPAFTANGTGATVVYSGTTQTCFITTYFNLTLATSDVKTFATTPTVNGVLSMEGTATITVTTGVVTYGGSATLKYNTATDRTASSEEWLTTFTASGGVVITNIGDITLNGNKTFTSCPLTIDAGATLNLSTFNLGSPSILNMVGGATTGASIIGSGLLTLGGNITIDDATTGTDGALISCPVALGSPRTFTVANDGTSATDLTISGDISTGGIAKAGAGTMILSNTNTYTGTTTISAGILKVGAVNALGSNSAVTLANTAGATLDITGFNTEIGSLAGGGASGGNLTLGAANLTAGDDNSSTTYSGIISGTGEVTKMGTGSWTLGGLNTYTGVTNINEGIIKFGEHGGASSGPLGNLGASSGTIVADGAALDPAGFSENNNELLTLYGLGSGGNGALRNSGAANTYAGLITLGSTSSIVGAGGTISVSNTGTITGSGFNLTLGGAQGGTLTSILGTGSGSLTKADAGTWILSGANTYTGTTTINAGALTLGAAGRINDGSAIILNGGTFRTGATTGFAETVSTLDVNASSGITLGTGSHTLTFAASNGLTWSDGTVLTITGWTGGYDGTASATAGRIFFGSTSSGLTTTQVAKIVFFNGTNNVPAKILSSGEIVPGETYFSIATGNWNANTTWSLSNGGSAVGSGIFPTAGDLVNILDDDIVTVNVNSECGALQLGATAITGAGTFGTLTFSSSSTLTVGGNVAVGGDGNANRDGTITFTSGSTLSAGSVTVGGTGATPGQGTITMTAGGTLKTGSFAVGAGSGTWTPGSGASQGTVELNQTNTLPATVITTFNKLIINGGTTTLGIDLNIITSLTMTDGYIIASATDVLTLNNGATANVGSDASYVKGPMSYLMAAANTTRTLVYPIGDDDDWRPAELTLRHGGSGSSRTYTAEVFNGDASAFGWWMPGTIDNVSKVHYWDVTLTGTFLLDTSAGNKPTIKLYYGANDNVQDASNLTICKNKFSTPSTWFDIGGSGATAGTGSVTSTGSPSVFSTFSRFTLGNKDGGSNPLPVKLVSFTSICNVDNVTLNWTTATEINNDYFTVESSSDGKNWTSVQNIKGAGNSSVLVKYSCVIPGIPSETVFYRLKQNDFDGKFEYSNIISVKNCNEGINSFRIFPNPGQGLINFEYNGDKKDIRSIEVFNVTGASVFKTGSFQDQADMSSLTPGIYYAHLISIKETYVQKIVIKK